MMILQENTEQTLHTLNKTRSVVSLNQELSDCIQKDDAIVLIEDGVYQCMSLPSDLDKHWSGSARHIYVLTPDAKARGITIDKVQHSKIVFIDYKDFVQLTLNYRKVISWY